MCTGTGLIVACLVAAIPSASAGKGSQALDEVPPEFAYTKTAEYRRFMALVRAAEEGNLRSVRALIRSGADVNGKDVDDKVAPTDRPLAVAAKQGHLAVVKALLAAGASVDACCCSCVTALHHAIRGRHAKIVARLLEAGADPTIRYDGKLSPLDLARQSGEPKIVRLLEARLTRAGSRGAGARPPSKGLVLEGTVVEIGQIEHPLTPWLVTVKVDRVVSGELSDPTFSFAVHSSAKSGLEKGRSYRVKAVWKGGGYVVDPFQWRRGKRIDTPG